jgi:hypothetical protein
LYLGVFLYSSWMFGGKRTMADQPDRNQPARKARPAAATSAADNPDALRPARPARSVGAKSAAGEKPTRSAAASKNAAADPAAQPARKATAAPNRAASAAPVAKPTAAAAKSAAQAEKPAAQAAAAKQVAAAKQAASTKSAEADALPEYEENKVSFIKQLLRDSPSWLVSAITHLVIVLVMATWMLPTVEEPVLADLSVNPNISEEPIEVLSIEPLEDVELEVNPEVSSFEPQPDTPNISDQAMVSEAMDIDAAQATMEVAELSVGPPVKAGLMTSVGAVSGTGMTGRGKAARTALVATGGGSPDSERAVALALKWLAAHQLPDGGWSYNHALAPSCQGKCDTPGKLVEARNAATAMGLLPFLGAGQTHVEGEYKQVVQAGLSYLINHEKATKQGGSWHEDGGRMYSHGLAAIVMCEAYGMTHDERLRVPAQAAVYFIMNVQDKVSGGWGYGGPGRDTSVAGWQIMALKSANMAYLEVWPASIRGIDNVLNMVSADSGASYGYNSPGRGAATTAVGCLSRLYVGKHFGWSKDHPAMQRAMETMAKAGPARNNLYRDYYAAQFMFQMTGAKGDMWEKWNTAMRDGIVKSQDQTGHQAGSWKTGYSHGRLMNTCLSTLILEVYYRHMLIAQDDAVKEDEFPLD